MNVYADSIETLTRHTRQNESSSLQKGDDNDGGKISWQTESVCLSSFSRVHCTQATQG